MALPAPRLRLALALCTPLALTALAYARVLDGEPVLDDQHTVGSNPAVRAPAAAARAALTGLVRGGGRPLTDLTFALDRALLGTAPRGAHAVSIALHLGVALLAFAFARRVLRLAGAARPGGVAAAAAGLLALHPLQTEAVAYLSQRSEVLASGLFLAALLLLLAADQRGPGWRGALAGLAAALALALALAAKPIAVTAPAAFLLTVLAVPGPAAAARAGRWRWRAALLAPLVLLVTVHAAATLAGTAGTAHAGFAVPGLPPAAYLATQARVIPAYLGLLAWPAGQCADHDVAAARSLLEPAALLGGALLLALAAAAVALARRARRAEGPGPAAARVAAFGLLWFLLLLAPTSSVVPLADVMAEHRVYLASLGPFLAAAVALERLLDRRLPGRGAAAGALLAAGVLAALGLATYRRNAVWETRLAFWADAAARSPGKARTHLGLGQALAARGDLDGALAAYGRARAVVGQNRPYQALVLRNVAVVHARAGRPALAAETYLAALALDPGDADVLSGLAILRAREGRGEEAAALAGRAVALAGEHAQALDVLAGLRLDAGDLEGAADLFLRASRAEPDAGVHRLGQGLALRAAGRGAEACAAFGEARRLALEPGQRAAVDRALAACR